MEVIYAIPGLGTTKDLYKNISVPGHQLKVLDWPITQKNLGLKDYALRFLDQIDHGKQIKLLGVSFGGMICSELAEHIPTFKVVLISTCRNALEFPPFLKSLRHAPVQRLLSDAQIRSVAKTQSKLLGFDKSFKPTFLEMIESMPENYFSHCIDYIINWSRITNTASCTQLHGTADKLLLFSKIRNCIPVKNGSHGMVLYNADEINPILAAEFHGPELPA